MKVATSSVEMTGMCRGGGSEKAGLSVVAAEGGFGSIELMSMWEWAWLAEEQLCSPLVEHVLLLLQFPSV